jgi:hypothetical protein
MERLERFCVSKASLRFVIVHRSAGLISSRTEYVCGQNTRSESRSCTGHSLTTPPTNVKYDYGPLRAYIHNRDLGYSFELDLAARIYTAFRANQYGSPRWLKPRQTQPLKRTGQTVHVQTETIDTGERLETFGYVARHVITKTTQIRDSQLLSQSESDGWYVDAPAAWATLHPAKPGTFYHVMSLHNGERDDYKFTGTGSRETGFMVRARQTHQSFFGHEDGTARVHENVSHYEIAEFSETPLKPELFVPPHGFRRVPRLPNEMRYSFRHQTRLRWEMLKDSFSLQNQISRFTHLL